MESGLCWGCKKPPNQRFYELYCEECCIKMINQQLPIMNSNGSITGRFGWRFDDFYKVVLISLSLLVSLVNPTYAMCQNNQPTGMLQGRIDTTTPSRLVHMPPVTLRGVVNVTDTLNGGVDIDEMNKELPVYDTSAGPVILDKPRQKPIVPVNESDVPIVFVNQHRREIHSGTIQGKADKPLDIDGFLTVLRGNVDNPCMIFESIERIIIHAYDPKMRKVVWRRMLYQNYLHATDHDIHLIEATADQYGFPLK